MLGRENKATINKKKIIVPPILSFCEFHNLALNLAIPEEKVSDSTSHTSGKMKSENSRNFRRHPMALRLNLVGKAHSDRCQKSGQ